MIEQNNIQNEKIYKDKQVWAGTFIGGPLVAGYLIAENFKALGDKDKVWRTWMIAVAATLLLIVISFSAPNIERVPNFVLPLLYTGIAFLLMRIFQGEKIVNHLRAGGKIHSWWRALGVSLFGMVVFSVLLFGTYFVLVEIENANTATISYGASKHNISYNKNNISENEIDAVGNAMIKTGFFDDGNPWEIYVKKVGNNYEITAGVERSILYKPQELEFFNKQKQEIQKLFPNNKIVINLVADSFDNVIKRIE